MGGDVSRSNQMRVAKVCGKRRVLQRGSRCGNSSVKGAAESAAIRCCTETERRYSVTAPTNPETEFRVNGT